MMNNPFAIAQKYLAKPTRTPAESKTVSDEDDPVVSFVQWYLIFHELHVKVVHETPNFDYLALKEQNPELYREIKTKENELDVLGDARLSEVMSLVRQWRELILRVHLEQ